MASAGDFRFLAESARRFLALLEDRPSFEREERSRGSVLIEHVDRTTSGLKARIREVETEYEVAPSETDRLEAIKEMRLLASYAHLMRRALPWLEDAKDSPLELGALYFIDGLALSLLGEPADIVPTRADEFSTMQRPFEALFQELELSPETGIRPIILNLPALEAGSFLLLPLFGHELGHTVVAKHNLISSVFTSAWRQPEFPVAITNARRTLEREMNLKEKRARIIVNERFGEWTTELLCDQLAMQHLGPSYLLAFAAYLVALSWNEPGPRHPPTTVRIAHLLAGIEGTQWEELLRERLPVSYAWLQDVAGAQRHPKLSGALHLLLDALDISREPIKRVVSDYLDGNIYKASEYLAHASHLDELLRYEILPVQHPRTGAAFEGRAIMMAGWLSIYEEVACSEWKETPALLCRALAQTSSHTFFIKALEMSCVLNIWGEQE